MSRREKIRENTREEIKTIARRLMITNGAATLSLNAIAREMEMTTPALYRYYANRDDLITALVTDAQEGLAQDLLAAIASSTADDAGVQLYHACLEYREWSITHPLDYQLLFGNPIPEYVCPPEVIMATGVTVFGIFLRLIQTAHEQKLFRPQPHMVNPPPALHITIQDVANGHFYDPVVSYIGIEGWAKMHGLVMLEMLHHLTGLVSDPALFYQNEIEAMMAHNGFTLPTT